MAIWTRLGNRDGPSLRRLDTHEVCGHLLFVSNCAMLSQIRLRFGNGINLPNPSKSAVENPVPLYADQKNTFRAIVKEWEDLYLHRLVKPEVVSKAIPAEWIL